VIERGCVLERGCVCITVYHVRVDARKKKRNRMWYVQTTESKRYHDFSTCMCVYIHTHIHTHTPARTHKNTQAKKCYSHTET